METRRVVRIGSSFYIALPKRWVLDRVGEGGVLALEVEEDGSLRIMPPSAKRAEDRKVIRLSCGKDLFRNIVSAYLRGFEVIEVSVTGGCRDEVMRVMERARQLLLGLELVGEEEDVIVLQCFTRPDYDLYSIVQRMSSITLEMLNLSLRAVATGDFSLAEKVLALDDIVDRLYFLAVRIIRSRISDPSYPSSEKVRLVDIRVVVRNFENIGDLFEKLFREGLERGKVDWELYELLSRFQKSVVSLALGLNDSREQALELYTKLEEKISMAEEKLPRRIHEVLEEVSSLLKDILDLS